MAVLTRNLPETIARDLRRAILRGDLLPGERLPSESNLAERYGTNRTTLREALRILHGEGLLDSGQGRQARVANFRETGTITLLPHLAEALPAGPDLLQVTVDMLRLRRDFLVILVEEAVERATEEELAEILRAGEDLLSRHASSALEIHHGDIRLMSALIRATHNLIYQLIVNTYMQTFSQMLERATAYVSFTRKYFEGIRHLLDAIARRDAMLAAERFKEHLESLDAEMVEMLLDNIGVALGGQPE